MRSGHSTRAEEWKDPEPSGEDQPDADAGPDTTLTGGRPAGMSEADVEGRSEIAAVLGKEIYPAAGARLVREAEEHETEQRVLDALRSLDPSATFTNAQQVRTSLGGEVEQGRF